MIFFSLVEVAYSQEFPLATNADINYLNNFIDNKSREIFLVNSHKSSCHMLIRESDRSIASVDGVYRIIFQGKKLTVSKRSDIKWRKNPSGYQNCVKKYTISTSEFANVAHFRGSPIVWATKLTENYCVTRTHYSNCSTVCTSSLGADTPLYTFVTSEKMATNIVKKPCTR